MDQRERERESVEWSSRGKRGLQGQRKVGGGKFRGPKRKDSLHPVLPLLDLPQNTGLLLVSGGQCLQPCDGGAVQLGSCARYDARRPDG